MVAALIGGGQFAVAGLPWPWFRGGRRPCRERAPAARAGPVRCLPAAVQGQQARRPARPVRDRPAGGRRLAFRGVSKNHAMNTAKVSTLLDVLLSHRGPPSKTSRSAVTGTTDLR